MSLIFPNKFSFGTDPEFFIVGKKTGRFFPAYPEIPGTKKEPRRLDGGMIQRDGLALEVNTRAVFTINDFETVFNLVMRQAEGFVRKGCKISYDHSSAHFDLETMKELPADVLELGCDPDFSGYTREENPRPDQHPTMRTASGHIHIGTFYSSISETDHFMECCDLAQHLDYYLGVPSIIMDRDGAERRKMYGQAGAFRPKRYGIEYRVLSNFWLKTPELRKWAFDNTMKAITDFQKEIWLPGDYRDAALNIINNDDVDAAIDLCKKTGIHYLGGKNG